MKTLCQLALASALLVATPAAAQSSETSEMSPSDAAIAAVLQHHIDSFKKRDVDALMADYAQDIVFVYFGNIVQGKGAMREAFEAHFADPNSGADQTELIVGNVDGDTGIIHWVVGRGTPEASQGDDVFVIRDHKIRFQMNTNVRPLEGE